MSQARSISSPGAGNVVLFRDGQLGHPWLLPQAILLCTLGREPLEDVGYELGSQPVRLRRTWAGGTASLSLERLNHRHALFITPSPRSPNKLEYQGTCKGRSHLFFYNVGSQSMGRDSWGGGGRISNLHLRYLH